MVVFSFPLTVCTHQKQNIGAIIKNKNDPEVFPYKIC